MAIKIKIQPAQQPDGTLPYPYWVNEDGTIGRQDFWKGRPARLVGFSSNFMTGNLDLPRFLFMLKAHKAIGKYPVFQDDQGNWYTADQIIESVQVVEAAK